MALDQVLLSKALKVEEKCQFLSCKSRFNCIFWCVLILFVVIHVCSYCI